MCGIAGILGDVNPSDIAKLRAMLAVMKYRGPDDWGAIMLDGAALGHRRLSVLDISRSGRQPMMSDDGRFQLTFNGEIYNYIELRKKLSKYFVFRTNTDSEVLLNAYRHWGDAFLEKLRGMYAFCIFDTLKKSAFLARDRFGQKSLCFHDNGTQLLFASEVKAILASGVEPKADKSTWSVYLASANYDHDHRTFFSGISQLRPGECANWSPQSGLIVRNYYSLIERVEERSISYLDAAEETRALMVDAAIQHMRSDVPVGISLSGGLDSSALVACFKEGGKLHDGVRAMFAHFGESYSEKLWVDKICQEFALSLSSFEFSCEEFKEYLSPMMWHLEGPIGGLMNCALTKVVKTARDCGITVLQDGSGVDEAFGGYRNHHNLFLNTLWANKSQRLEQALHDYARNWDVSYGAALLVASTNALNAPVTIDGTSPIRPDLLHPSVFGYMGEAKLNPSPLNVGEDPLLSSLCDFLQASKIPRNARMKDRSSMAFGIELRAPFLDHVLVEASLSLPKGYFFDRGRSKAIVRDALSDLIPHEVREAPKRSVHAPQGEWLKIEPMRGYVESIIYSESFADRGFFNPKQVQRSYKDFLEHGSPNSFFIWQWINVEEWFRTFIDQDSTVAQNPLCPELLRIAA